MSRSRTGKCHRFLVGNLAAVGKAVDVLHEVLAPGTLTRLTVAEGMDREPEPVVPT